MNKIKLHKETLKAIWDASRPTVQRNKKKYTRKSKHKLNTNTNR